MGEGWRIHECLGSPSVWIGGDLRPVQDDYSLMKLSVRLLLLAQASKRESRWCSSLSGLCCGSNIQARLHLPLCALEQEEESERGMRRKCHHREGACSFSSHAPVGQTKTNIAVGQQQRTHRVKACENQSKQHSAPALTLGQKPDCVVSRKRVISANAFHASELRPSAGGAIHTVPACLQYSQQKQTHCISQTNNHSNNRWKTPLAARLCVFARLKWLEIHFVPSEMERLEAC